MEFTVEEGMFHGGLLYYFVASLDFFFFATLMVRILLLCRIFLPCFVKICQNNEKRGESAIDYKTTM